MLCMNGVIPCSFGGPVKERCICSVGVECAFFYKRKSLFQHVLFWGEKHCLKCRDMLFHLSAKQSWASVAVGGEQ